jgi:hypothetical protein
MRCRGSVASCLLAIAVLSCAVQAQQQPTAPSKSSAKGKAATLDSGSISADLYRNLSFGITCKIPFGWVNRTREMSEDSGTDSNQNSSAPKKSTLLLAVFERPPEATGDSVNSAVVIAAESASSYPGLRTAEQYFEPLTAVTKSKGLDVVNEPYDYHIGAMQLVRGDFSKALGNLTMHQSTLVMLEKGYLISFTFIGGTEDEVDDLLGGLHIANKEGRMPRN